MSRAGVVWLARLKNRLEFAQVVTASSQSRLGNVATDRWHCGAVALSKSVGVAIKRAASPCGSRPFSIAKYVASKVHTSHSGGSCAKAQYAHRSSLICGVFRQWPSEILSPELDFGGTLQSGGRSPSGGRFGRSANGDASPNAVSGDVRDLIAGEAAFLSICAPPCARDKFRSAPAVFARQVSAAGANRTAKLPGLAMSFGN